MPGQHLRRGRGAVLRALLAVVAVLVVGAALGAGGSLLFEDRAGEVRTADAPATAQLVPEPGPITIALVGDVAMASAVADRLDAAPEDLVGPIADVLRDADLTIANLDVPIAVDPATVDVPAAPPRILGALVDAGIDVVSMANDRSLDLGPGGVYEMLAADEDLRVLVGVGADEDAAYRPFVRDIGGHTVAVIGATQLLDAERIATDTAGPDQAGVASAKRIDRLVAEVEAARTEADTVVVYVHWGAEGETCPGPGQQELAAALVAAGADVVGGPGAGRLQGAGRAGEAAVAYGLGRFIADDPADPSTGVLLVQVDGRDVLDIEWVPAVRTDGVPVALEGDEATAAAGEWDSLRDCTDLSP